MAGNSHASGLIQSCWDLCGLSDDELSQLDIAGLNLATAQGLPGVERIDVVKCLSKLDDWADRVKLDTLRQIYRFDPRSGQAPSEFNYGNSLGRFCCYVLLQVLQEDCGVVYNPARKFDPDFSDPADMFIHGILDDVGAGGTCATMPVVYVAVARRLGYPVKLVETREHLFFRWEDPRGTIIHWQHTNTEFWLPPDRFNVEGAGEGIAYYPDSFYIQWPHLWKESDFMHGRYLRPLSSKDELASFFIERGECFWELRSRGEALKAYWHARQLTPDDKRYEWLHAKRTHEYERELELDRERMLEINELNRRAHVQRQENNFFQNTSRPLKLAYGTPRPAGLPLTVPVQYVRPEEADVTLPVGRPLRVAAGRPIPSNLPPNTAIQFVPPEMVDPLPSKFQHHSKWDSCCSQRSGCDGRLLGAAQQDQGRQCQIVE